MASNEGPETLILPEPSHLGYVTRDIERTKENLRKGLGLGSFTMMTPDYFNKRVYGKTEDFKPN